MQNAESRIHTLGRPALFAFCILPVALLAGACAKAQAVSVPDGPPLLVPTALLTGLTGLFLVVARGKAIVQALGYLVFENGIYAFGLAIAHEEPLLVQLGVLLDLLVAVFVMGIIVFRIQRDFEHIDVGRLVALHDAVDASPPPERAP